MIELFLAASALALAAAAVQAAVDARSVDPGAAAGSAALGGAAVVAVLLLIDGGRLLRWRYALGAGADRLELPGAALVLGVALLATLAGTLAAAAHLLSSGPAPKARRLGQSLLILGAGLAAVAAALVLVQAVGRRAPAIVSGAPDLASLVVSIGVLVLALTRLLAPVAAGVAEARRARAERMLPWAAALAAAALGAAGVEAWRAQGSYATPAVAEAASVAVLGLVARQPARFALARSVLFLMALTAMVARVARPG